MSSLCSSLSVPAGNVKFAHLNGVIPLTEILTQGKKEEAERAFIDFSGSPPGEDKGVSGSILHFISHMMITHK